MYSCFGTGTNDNGPHGGFTDTPNDSGSRWDNYKRDLLSPFHTRCHKSGET